MGSIEHQAAGAFEMLALVFMCRQVDDLADMETVLMKQRIDNVLATLRATVSSFHRIENNRAIGVKADPVVWKYRVRCMWVRGILDDDNMDARLQKDSGKHIEFRQCRSLLLLLTGIEFPLKPVRCRCQGIAVKPHGPNHQYGRSQL